MKKLRTRYFQIAFSTVLGCSALFLGWMLLFGKRLAITHFDGLADAVFAVFGLAAASFLAFCFVPYFRGDRRWYSISALLTLVFCVGTAMVWQITGTAVTV